MNKDLPEGWKWIKLGDIAFEVSDRIDSPSESGLERFVGLEHMDSESLTVKRWGSTEDVTSAMKLFKKGDMLFARRNAYLKRASMATFDGVCSGDAIVLRQKNAEYVNGLLPLILNTENLWEFAIANASGSMSKRVKWRDLATFEIPLPPKEEQRSIADILWAAEDYIVKNEKLVDETESYKKILMRELFTKGIGHNKFKDTERGKIPEEWEVERLGAVLVDIKYGTSVKANSDDKGSPVLGIPNILGGKIDETSLKCVVLSELEKQNLMLKNGDILLVRTNGNPSYIGRCALFENKKGTWVYASYLIRIRVDSKRVIPKFLAKFLQSERVRRQFLSLARTSAGNYNINSEDIRSIIIYLPNLQEQCRIVEIFSELDDTIQKAQENVNKIKELKKILLNQFLNGGLETAISINQHGKQVGKQIVYETQVSE